MHQRYLIDSGNVPVGYKLEKGSSAPGIIMIKKFILWYYACFTRRRLQPDGRATVIATLVCAERFFSGFETATGNRVAPADRSEIYRVSIAGAAKIDDAG
ncbi:hypothetical protein N7530_002402 [Penicillium desertorum]|uniref:Uncharacterized protein n=1 Tax=Penicillium desertorum TaxID=1303715 RepID=A0A9W9X3N4_9EURO|nr:hypothetical protein N7530_002402 [Penicillium desertorum]